MKRLLVVALVLVPVALLGVLQLRTEETPGEAAPGQAVPPPERAADPYIRAAHWFGEAWPVNFWNHSATRSLLSTSTSTRAVSRAARV